MGVKNPGHPWTQHVIFEHGVTYGPFLSLPVGWITCFFDDSDPFVAGLELSTYQIKINGTQQLQLFPSNATIPMFKSQRYLYAHFQISMNGCANHFQNDLSPYLRLSSSPALSTLWLRKKWWFTGWWFQPLWKNISQLGWSFPTYGKIKHVPNHQLVYDDLPLKLKSGDYS